VTKSCSMTSGRPLSPAQQTLAREVFEGLSGKWTIWILDVLGETDGPMRFARLQEAVSGISQKVLTKTLRQLECDGFLTRTVFAQVPPRVEYQLTDLGKRLLVEVTPLFKWIVTEISAFEKSRTRFERHEDQAD
jgi:DNA-binding HxlR family transcriptional regulator